MNCQDIQKFAFTYLDGEFADHERGEFEEHLRRCPPCRTGIDRDALMRELVSRHLKPAPCGVRALATGQATSDHPAAGQGMGGQALRARVCARLDRADRQHRNQTLAVTVAAVAVVLVAVAVSTGVPGDRVTGTTVAVAPVTGTTVAVPPVTVPPVAMPEQVQQVLAVANAGPSALIPTQIPSHAKVVAASQADFGGRGAALPGGAAVRRVSAHIDLGSRGDEPGEVLGGRLPVSALVERSPFGAVRSEAGLRQMVQVHIANLMPEVAGLPARIERYVQERLPGAGSLPLALGAGVQLRGARIGVLGGQPTVIYSYTAFGTALTVVSRARAQVEDSDVERTQPDVRAPSGVLLDRRGGLHLVHVVAGDRMLTLVGELSPQAMLQLLPTAPLL